MRDSHSILLGNWVDKNMYKFDYANSDSYVQLTYILILCLFYILYDIHRYTLKLGNKHKSNVKGLFNSKNVSEPLNRVLQSNYVVA